MHLTVADPETLQHLVLALALFSYNTEFTDLIQKQTNKIHNK